MFRLHKARSEKSSPPLKLHFSFSGFHLSQVPRGWDKLFVLITSVETGKNLAKSGKASVRSGNCRWTETLSESIVLSQEDPTKEFEQCLIKLVVAMGSTRSGILGEATVNLACHLSSKASVPLTIPLEKCTHESVLQVRIKCLTQRANARNEQSRIDTAFSEDANAGLYDIECNSDVSESCFTRSIESSSSNCMDSSSHLGESGHRDSTFSTSGSRNSFDSMEGSSGIENVSPRSNLSESSEGLVGRQASIDSQTVSQYASYLFSDNPRSVHSSFSKISGSRRHHPSQTDDLTRASSALVSSQLRNTVSSKERDFADATNVELRAEAKMWERNARKMMLDLERLREAFSEQSKSKESLDIDLSASRTECDGLKREIDQLRVLLEESKERTSESQYNQPNDTQRQLEDELKFLKESNTSLNSQLQRTQESNIELVSILQELEDTIEKQKFQIASFPILKSETEEGCPVENTISDLHEDSGPEDIKNMEKQVQQFQESKINFESTIQLLERAVEDKTHEIETERVLKIQSLLDCEREWRRKLAAKEEECLKLEVKLSEILASKGSDGTNSDNEGDCNLRDLKVLREKVQELERDCNELTEENLELLVKLKESGQDPQSSGAASSSFSCCPHCSSYSSHEAEASQLSFKICQSKEVKVGEVPTEGDATSSLQAQCISLENKCTDLEIQLQAFRDGAFQLDSELYDFRVKVEEQEMEIASLQYQLQNCQRKEDHANDAKGTQNSESDATVESCDLPPKLFQQLQMFINRATRMPCLQLLLVDMECKDSRENLEGQDPISQGRQVGALLENFIQLNKLLEAKCQLCKDNQFQAGGSANEVQNMQDGLLKESSSCCSSHISNSSGLSELGEIKDSREELSHEISGFLQENEQVESSMMIDSHVSAKKNFERISSELENTKLQLDLHISELEEENVQLSERISGLEAQLRYLTDERESNRLELQHSASCVMKLQDEVRRLEDEMDAGKREMTQKLLEMQQRWFEAQEENQYIKRVNPKLQSTAENIMEECSFLQKSNTELRMQNSDVHRQCTILEAELRETKKLFSTCLERINALEGEFHTLQEEITLKENILYSEIDALRHENEKHRKELQEETELYGMYLEKKSEVENLQSEIVHLSELFCCSNEEREKRSSEPVFEVSTLRAQNTKLTAALKDVQEKLERRTKELDRLQIESEAKENALLLELAKSKQKQDILVVDHEKVLGLLEEVKSAEQGLKSLLHASELKLKTSEYERLQLLGEFSVLKDQLLKISQLQDEVSNLKCSLSESKLENERLEASLELSTRDYEQMKAEQASLDQKMSCMQKAVSELEECRHSKVALQEKVLRLEGDLIAREASTPNDAKLKNELGRVTRTNSQLQRKIKGEEEEKEELLKIIQRLQRELKHNVVNKERRDSTSDEGLLYPAFDANSTCNDEESAPSELLSDEMAETGMMNDDTTQFKSISSDGRSSSSIVDTSKDACEKTSALEAELRDIHERYFYLSLKYAEVESEREELLMKLKTTEDGRS